MVAPAAAGVAVTFLTGLTDLSAIVVGASTSVPPSTCVPDYDKCAKEKDVPNGCGGKSYVWTCPCKVPSDGPILFLSAKN